ncbi:MAG: SurA N-terminal domain-containing protein [Rhodocyclaceae bacterium]
MFKVIRENPRIAQVILAVIALPFVFSGVASYVHDMSGSGDEVAKVGQTKITNGQLDEAVRTQQQTMRAQMGDSFSQEDAESPRFRQAVLENLINQSVIQQSIEANRLLVPDQAVTNYIFAMPDFQENGVFSKTQYAAVLQANGMVPAQFEDRVRANLAQQMLLAPIVQTASVPKSTLQRWLVLQDEERTIVEWPLNAAQYLNKVALADGAAKTYYDSHQSEFQLPERIKAEYVVLSVDEISSQVKVSDEDARKWYDSHKDKYQVPEERRASHILIKVAADATQAQKDAAHKKAEDVLAKVKAKPADFAQLAKQYSEDTSAQSGGDLGFMGRGALVKPFEDAMFALKPHEISDLVVTEYGYHIIRVAEVRGGTVKPFEAAKADIIVEASRDMANRRYAEASEQFGNMVYEQSDSFKPVAEKLGLKVQQSDWIARDQSVGGAIGNAKVISKLFDAESIKARRNIEALDLGNGVMLSARVTDHQAASQKPFEEVKARIEAQLTGAEAAKLAKADGEAKLAKLKAGDAAGAAWSAPRAVKRGTPGLSIEARKAIFASPSGNTPAFAGAETPAGYTLYRVDKVVAPEVKDDDPTLAQAGQMYAQILGDQDGRDYLAGMRERLGTRKKAVTAAGASESAPKAE